MLSFEMKNHTLVMTKDDDDNPTLPEMIEALANSIDVDFVRMENEGAPVYLGNDYAEYRVTVLDGESQNEFGIGPKERWALLAYDNVAITPYPTGE